MPCAISAPSPADSPFAWCFWNRAIERVAVCAPEFSRTCPALHEIDGHDSRTVTGSVLGRDPKPVRRGDVSCSVIPEADGSYRLRAEATRANAGSVRFSGIFRRRTRPDPALPRLRAPRPGPLHADRLRREIRRESSRGHRLWARVVRRPRRERCNALSESRANRAARSPAGVRRGAGARPIARTPEAAHGGTCRPRSRAPASPARRPKLRPVPRRLPS